MRAERTSASPVTLFVHKCLLKCRFPHLHILRRSALKHVSAQRIFKAALCDCLSGISWSVCLYTTSWLFMFHSVVAHKLSRVKKKWTSCVENLVNELRWEFSERAARKNESHFWVNRAWVPESPHSCFFSSSGSAWYTRWVPWYISAQSGCIYIAYVSVICFKDVEQV